MIARLKRWWRDLWPLNDADRAYLTGHREAAERTTLASRARRKRLEVAAARFRESGNPIPDAVRGVRRPRETR